MEDINLSFWENKVTYYKIELKNLLQKAVEDENYEEAAKLRDLINK